MGEQVQRAAELGDSVNGHPEQVSAALPELKAILRALDDDDAFIEAFLTLGPVAAWRSTPGPRLTLR